jgi:iron(III) transport system permease protein
MCRRVAAKESQRNRDGGNAGPITAASVATKMSNGQRIRPTAPGLLWLCAVLAACALLFFAVTDPDARTWSLWKNSLRLAGGTVALAVPLGTLAAILIHRSNAWGRNAGWFALTILLFSPIYLQAAGWDAWFGRQTWLWQGQHAHTHRMLVAIWIHAAAAIPWVAMMVGAALLQITPELEESALMDMSVPAVLASITLPLCWPAILLSCWWVAVMTGAEMTVTDLYQIRTYAEEIYTTIPLLEDVTFQELALQTAPRAAWIMFGCIGLSLLFIGALARHEYPPSANTRLELDLGNGRLLASFLLFVLAAIIVAAPVITLCFDAGSYVESGAVGGQRSWSAKKFMELVASSPLRFRRELVWTIAIGACAATLGTVLAIGLGSMARNGKFGALLTLVLATLCAAIPGPMIALGIITLLNRESNSFSVWLYDRTILAPVLAGAIRSLPVTIAVVWWGIRTVPSELNDLAKLDGLGTLQRIWHVLWPTRRELILAAWCAAFAIAIGDLGATVLVTPPGVSTLAIRVFGLLHAGVNDQVAAICLVNILLCVGLALAAKFLMSRRSGD